MELIKVSQVSRDCGISTRMLRYYEQAGLIRSLRKDDYAYRVYEEGVINRLRQIIVLRKLRVPVKQIARILNNNAAAEVVEIFRRNISEIDEEITALSSIKLILTRFVEEINEKTDVNLKLLTDESLLSVIGALSFSDNKLKETKEDLIVEDLNKASQTLGKYEDRDVRIVYLPPMTIAAAYAEGESCEEKTLEAIKQFVLDNNLAAIKPDLRQFGFNCSNDSTGKGESSHAYETWVSIPEHMKVSASLVKRNFTGGLYAAHILRDWSFQDWKFLREWVEASDKYDSDWGNPRGDNNVVTGQGFEEFLNYYSLFNNPMSMSEMQLDLLFPVKPAPAVFPYEMQLPLNDANWTFWEPSGRYIAEATSVIIEYDGEIIGNYAFARHYPSPWAQYEKGDTVFKEEPGRIIINLHGTGGANYGFAVWEKGEAAKVKRIYMINEVTK